MVCMRIRRVMVAMIMTVVVVMVVRVTVIVVVIMVAAFGVVVVALLWLAHLGFRNRAPGCDTCTGRNSCCCRRQ